MMPDCIGYSTPHNSSKLSFNSAKTLIDYSFPVHWTGCRNSRQGVPAGDTGAHADGVVLPAWVRSPVAATFEVLRDSDVAEHLPKSGLSDRLRTLRPLRFAS